MILRAARPGSTFLRVIDKRSGAPHRLATSEPDYALSLATKRGVRHGTMRFKLSVDGHAGVGLRLPNGTPRRTLLKQQEVVGGYDPARIMRGASGRGAGRHQGAGLAGPHAGLRRWPGADAALRLRFLRHPRWPRRSPPTA